MKNCKTLFLTLGLLTLSSFAGATEQNFGVVNFSKCVTESKYGVQEQESFNKVKTQMSDIITDLEKQLQEIANKFNDSEFLDSLSPEAEQELKGKFQMLSEEYNRYQNQSMQVLNQANMKMMQTINQYVTEASNQVAKDKKLNFVFREEALLSYSPSSDITASVVKVMDTSFDKMDKGATAQTNPPKN